MTNTDVLAVALDTEAMSKELTSEKLRFLKSEMEALLEEFDREYCINYLAGNFAVNTHLCTVVLRGKHDDELRKIMNDTISSVALELQSRKKN